MGCCALSSDLGYIFITLELISKMATFYKKNFNMDIPINTQPSFKKFKPCEHSIHMKETGFLNVGIGIGFRGFK